MLINAKWVTLQHSLQCLEQTEETDNTHITKPYSKGVIILVTH